MTDEQNQTPADEPHALFGIDALGMNELRQPTALTDKLKDEPFRAVSLERYGTREGVAISAHLWEILMDVARGTAQIFDVPVQTASPQTDRSWTKRVVARELPRQEDAQRWEVLIDGVSYAMSATASGDGAREEPDYDQVIWRHHEDAARQILARFPRPDA